MKYQKNFITEVICRLNFSYISSIDKEEPPKFLEKVKPLFPRLEKGVEINLDLKGIKGVSLKKQSRKWTFLDKEKNKKVTLGPEFMALIFNRYNDFDEFKEIWENVYNILLEVYKIEFFDRLGLRYINQIELKKGNPLIWKKLINKHLVTNLESFPDLKADIVRSMHQTIFNIDGTKINFNHGIFNEHFPDALSDKKYILDYDCYCDVMIDPSEVNDKISEFIKIIYDLFEKSIEDNLRKIMGEKIEE